MSNKNGDTSPSQLSGSSEEPDMDKRAANSSGSDTTNMSTKSANQQKERNEGEGVALPLSLMKALRRKPSSVGIGSNSSNEGGSGNNSDNSALVSLGNNSFGFNFDSEEGLLNNSSPANSETDAKTGESENGSKRRQRGVYVPSEVQTKSDRSGRKRHSILKSSSGGGSRSSGSSNSGSGSDNGNGDKSTVSSLTSTTPSSGSNKNGPSVNREAAIAETVANLHPISASHTVTIEENRPINHHQSKKATTKAKKSPCKKRKAEPNEDTGNDSGGYNSDDEGGARSSSAVSHAAAKTQQHPQQHPPPPQHPEPAKSSLISCGKRTGPLVTDSSTAPTAPESAESSFDPNKKPKFLDESKREERNAREKERSFRISKQINELRNLLSSGGVIVPKGTKSSVLTEAANYIRMLQQHQYRSEIDRHHLIQQMQMIGTGAMGPQAAQSVRHAAAQNGVWSLGNFGGVPPRSAMSYYEQGKSGVPGNAVQSSSSTTTPENNSQTPQLAQSVEDHEYRHIFNSCPLGMAIASMGGAFVDCNQLFCQLSNYTKQEICSMTIFNLTSRQDLQPAFDLISQMISPPAGPQANISKPVVLRGSMKDRDDLGLSVALIKGEDGIAKNFSVTLIINPASPFDPNHPSPASADLIQTNTTEPVSQPTKDNGAGALPTEPAYTTG